ncbi:hypothetical protein ACVLV4_000523 [Rathayibacter agropyri]
MSDPGLPFLVLRNPLPNGESGPALAIPIALD